MLKKIVARGTCVATRQEWQIVRATRTKTFFVRCTLADGSRFTSLCRSWVEIQEWINTKLPNIVHACK